MPIVTKAQLEAQILELENTIDVREVEIEFQQDKINLQANLIVDLKQDKVVLEQGVIRRSRDVHDLKQQAQQDERVKDLVGEALKLEQEAVLHLKDDAFMQEQLYEKACSEKNCLLNVARLFAGDENMDAVKILKNVIHHFV